MNNSSYKIKVTFSDNSYKYITANAAKLQKSGNVINYCKGKFPFNDIKEIKTRCWNNNTKKYYWTLNYNLFFEHAKNNKLRVQATNEKGYEDYSGYGSRTDGKINRFYIGRSLGWIPIYLEILRNDSIGGCALTHSNREFTLL